MTEPTKSRVTVEIEFHDTADTPRYRAEQIAARIQNFVAADMDTAGTTVKVVSHFLAYKTAFAAEAEAFRGRSNPMGNPDKDWSN